VSNFLSALTGSFSQGAGKNPTVSIMEAGFEAAHVDVRYINCEVAPEDLANAVKGAIAMGWLGFNCSLPHKEKIIAHLDSVGESARLIGAVNTVVIRGRTPHRGKH
jgi:shikimate dehydrogenase